jgi:translation initiation factor 2 beta subunit (eIF-2beta)/eIF-5
VEDVWYKQPIPKIVQTALKTQKALSEAKMPSGLKYKTVGMPEHTIKIFLAMIQANDKPNKNVRKYRAQYWVNHQVDEELQQYLP